MEESDAGQGEAFQSAGGLLRFLAFTVATWFGSGLAPRAPGTFGTLAAVPVAWLSSGWPLSVRAGFWVVLFLVGIWAAARVGRESGRSDDQRIVVDEVLGYAITAWLAKEWSGYLAAFALFRFFDITKLPPVGAVDRWSKSRRGLSGGFGVIADDLVAGVQALLVWLLLARMGWVA